MNRLPILCLSTLCLTAALVACSPAAGPAPKAAEPALAAAQAAPPKTAGPATASLTAAPAGLYTMDMQHSSLNFRVRHMGISNYTARFTSMDGKLQFDPANPAAASVTVNIDPRSIQTNYPGSDLDFDAQIAGPEFFDAKQFPKATFQSTKVEVTGENTARVTGDLTFHGVSRPVVLETTFNGGYAPMDIDPSGARIGFSAHGSLKRSEFGMGYGVPAAGTTMGVSDEVEIAIEAEFTKK